MVQLLYPYMTTAKIICCSVPKSYSTLYSLMSCSMPGFSVFYYLRTCSDLPPSSWWYHPTISSSVIPFSFSLQSFKASGSLPRSQFFSWGGHSIRSSASASVLPMNIQGWFPFGLTGLISLVSKGLSRVFSSTSLKASILQHSAFFMVQLSHLYMTIGKNKTSKHSFDYTDLCQQSDVSAFNILSRFVIASLPKSKCLLISWLQSSSPVILEPKKIKSVTVSTFPFLCTVECWDQMPWS